MQVNELIETFKNDDGTTVVDGRSLYEFLEIETPYTQWFERMLDYGFTKNVDFVGLSQKSEKPRGGRPQENHAISMDMAKELSMIQRTDRGKQARQYFIAMEQKAVAQAQLPTTTSGKIRLLLENSDELDRRIDKTNKRIDDLEDNQFLSPGEYGFVNTLVKKTVSQYVNLHDIDKGQRSKLFKDISNGINAINGTKTRTQLRQRDFDRTIEFISNWQPSVTTVTLIKQEAELIS